MTDKTEYDFSQAFIDHLRAYRPCKLLLDGVSDRANADRNEQWHNYFYGQVPPFYDIEKPACKQKRIKPWVWLQMRDQLGSECMDDATECDLVDEIFFDVEIVAKSAAEVRAIFHAFRRQLKYGWGARPFGLHAIQDATIESASDDYIPWSFNASDEGLFHRELDVSISPYYGELNCHIDYPCIDSTCR